MSRSLDPCGDHNQVMCSICQELYQQIPLNDSYRDLFEMLYFKRGIKLMIKTICQCGTLNISSIGVCHACSESLKYSVGTIDSGSGRITYQGEVLPDEQSKISDLEDKLYHATREVDEVKYLLGHKIEVLEKQKDCLYKLLIVARSFFLDKENTPYADYDVRDAVKETIKEIECMG